MDTTKTIIAPKLKKLLLETLVEVIEEKINELEKIEELYKKK